MWMDKCFTHSFPESTEPDIDMGVLRALHSTYMEQLLGDYRVPSNDGSIYTGDAGIAYLLYKKEKYDLAQKYINMRGVRDISLFTGKVGVHTVAALVAHALGDIDKTQMHIDFIKHLAPITGNHVNECLYGRSGYLLACALLEEAMGSVISYENVIKPVIDQIMRDGSVNGDLMWKWHAKEYLGAAHGVAGILYVIIRYYSRYLDENPTIYMKVKRLLDNMCSLQYDSGNFPSSCGSKSGDRLVQWCHGAPGWIFTLVHASKYFSSETFMKSAIEAGNCCWKRGLLRKGTGICHGVCGNAYSLSCLWQATQDEVWLRRLQWFVKACILNVYNVGTKEAIEQDIVYADTPLSLFEGCAGRVFLLGDFIHNGANRMKFPCY